jgi:hypothetical protein
MLDIAGRKPWETKHLLDTMDMWKFGDNKNYTSLRLLAALFGFPSPKDDMDGSEVAGVYWEERDLDRIAAYCEKDVLATAQLFLKMKRHPVLRQDQVVIVPPCLQPISPGSRQKLTWSIKARPTGFTSMSWTAALCRTSPSVCSSSKQLPDWRKNRSMFI